jgi:structural maintenance of chromosomes protein 6
MLHVGSAVEARVSGMEVWAHCEHLCHRMRHQDFCLWRSVSRSTRPARAFHLSLSLPTSYHEFCLFVYLPAEMASQGFFAQFRSTAPNHASSSFSSDTTMPSRKRTRDATAETDGEVEIESASSSFRQNYPKRSRVAMAAENGGSVISDDEEDEEDEEVYMNGHDDAETDAGVDAVLDMSEDDDEEDEASDEFQMNQAVQRQMRELRENVASEQGIVEEVFCRNFMCHAKLRIKLGPNINFIIGHNGSGKSAVLTALTMCLGGKATATNRGSSLKSLIKEGEESATLAVKIKNHGEAAYKPELYGHTITVERNFSRSSTSGFKIKNADDKTISTKKQELEELCDYFAFQLDNPINVLTQDMARQFLSNSSPAEKYKFFIRGTQLETLDNDYNLIEERLDGVLVKLANREADLEILKNNRDEALKSKQRLDGIRKMREKRDRYQFMHAWAQVEEQESTLAALDREVEQAEELVRDREDEAETHTGTFEGHEQSHAAAKRHTEQLTEQLRPVEQNCAAEQEAYVKKKNELEEVHSQQRNIRDQIKKLKERQKTLEKKLAEEQERIAGAGGAEHTQRMARLEELRGRVEEVKRELQQHQQERQALLANKTAAEDALEELTPSRRRREEEHQKARSALQALQRTARTEYEAYSPGMDHLVRAVNNETRWRGPKPVGPMGKYIRLRPDKTDWLSQIQRTFGGQMEAFVVSDTDDHKLLREIMRRVNCQPPILMGRPEPLNTTGKEPDDPRVDTIYRVLTFDNDLVRNSAIINQAVEQVCLIGNGEAARNFLESRPRNVRAVIAHGVKPGEGVQYQLTRTGNMKSNYNNAWLGKARIQTDRQEEIRVQQAAVDRALQELDGVKQDVREKEVALNRAKQDLTRWTREHERLKVEVMRAEDAVEEQNNEIERYRPEDGKLQELERQLQEAVDDLERDQNSYTDAVNQKDKLGDETKELRRRLEAAQEEVANGQARLKRAQEQEAAADESRYKALLDKNAALGLVDRAKADLAEVQEKRDKQQEKVHALAHHTTP